MKFKTLFLAGLLCAGFTACGDDEESTTPTNTNTQTTEQDDDTVVVPEALDSIHGSTTVAWSAHFDAESMASRFIDEAFFVVDAKIGSGKHYTQYSSTLWGTTKGANLTFTEIDGRMTFNGTDSITMKRMGNGPEASYLCKIEGGYVASAKQMSATIDVLKDDEVMYKLVFTSK